MTRIWRDFCLASRLRECVTSASRKSIIMIFYSIRILVVRDRNYFTKVHNLNITLVSHEFIPSAVCQRCIVYVKLHNNGSEIFITITRKMMAIHAGSVKHGASRLSRKSNAINKHLNGWKNVYNAYNSIFVRLCLKCLIKGN